MAATNGRGRPRKAGPLDPPARPYDPRQKPNTTNGNGHAPTAKDLPVDYGGEAELLMRAMAPDVVDVLRPPAIRAILGSEPDLFWHPHHRRIADTVRALSDAGYDPTRRHVLERLEADTPAGYFGAGEDGKTPREHWEAIAAGLKDKAFRPGFELFVSPETVDDLVLHLERYRRQRLMYHGAQQLQDAARAGTDWLELVEDLAALGRTNGAVISASTLELIDFSKIIDGDAPDVEAFWLRRLDDFPLLYPGRLHDLHAEPSIGKTWIAVEAIKQVLDGGGNVLYLDYEDTGQSLYSRLLAVGVHPDLLRTEAGRFRYINPAGALEALELAQLDAIVDELRPDLAVIDGVAEALARDGFDESSNTDVVLWAERVPRPIARRGAAVLMLDHVPKNPEGRTRGARGAGAKLAIIDGVSYDVRLASPFSRHRAGIIKLIVAKDRPGQVGAIGEAVADIHVVPHHGGAVVELRLETPPDTAGGFRPTGIMQALSERLETSTHPLSGDLVLRSTRRGKRSLREEALTVLVAEGFVLELIDGITNARLYRSVKPFREVDDAIRRRPGTPRPEPLLEEPPEPDGPTEPYQDEIF